MQIDYAGLHTAPCSPSRMVHGDRLEGRMQRPFQSWLMKRSHKEICVLKTLLTQKRNVVAFVMGRAFTWSFRLQTAKLSAFANIVKGHSWPSSIFKTIQVSWRTK